MSGLDIQLEQFKNDKPACKNLSRAIWVRILSGAKLSGAPLPFCTEPVSALTHKLYIAALFMIFLLGFRQWRFRAERANSGHEHQTSNVLGHPIGVGPWALTLSHVLAWRMGVIIVIVYRDGVQMMGVLKQLF